MTAKERILAIKLLEKLESNPEYAKQIGVQVSMGQSNPKERKEAVWQQ